MAAMERPAAASSPTSAWATQRSSTRCVKGPQASWELHDVASGRSDGYGTAQLQTLEPVFCASIWKGMPFELQTSTDLNQWSPLTTVTSLTGTLEFTDPDAASRSWRFYRTVAR
jgi:hypothetical protein